MNNIFSFINTGSGFGLPNIPGLTPLFQGEPGNIPKQYVSGIDSNGQFILTTDPSKAVNGAVVAGGSARPTDQIKYQDQYGNVYQYSNSPGINSYNASETAYLQLVSGPGLTDPSKLPQGGSSQTPDQILTSGNYRDLGSVPVGQSLTSYASSTPQFNPSSGPVINGQAVGSDFSTNSGLGTGFTSGGVSYGGTRTLSPTTNPLSYTTTNTPDPNAIGGNRVLASSTVANPVSPISSNINPISTIGVSNLQAPDLTQIPVGQPFNYGGLQYIKNASGGITPYNGNSSQINTPSNTNVGGVDISSLPPDQQGLLQQLQSFLTKLQQNGQTINPNIQITPEQTAQFLSQAKNEIDPYYQNQLKISQDQLNQYLGYNEQQVIQNETLAQINYQNTLRNFDQSYADQGFAQSGGRNLANTNLATQTQIGLDQSRQAFQNSAYNAASNFAQQFGSENLPGSTQSITNEPRVISGSPNFLSDSNVSPVYSLSNNVYNGLTGSQQYQENVDVQNRANQLGQAYLQQQATQQQRSLTL